MTTTSRTALVVGASRGIGRATAGALAKRGFMVCAASRTGDAPPACRWAAAVDIRHDDSVDRLWRMRENWFDGLDLLVITAGTAVTGRLDDVSPGDLARMLEEHVVAVYRLVRVFRPLLAARQGHIMLMLSRMGRRPRMHGHGYGTAKAALQYLAGCLALDLAEQRIRVNCVSPGAVRTDLHRRAMPHADSDAVMAPEVIGEMVAELADHRFEHMNGAVIDVPMEPWPKSQGREP